MSISGRVKKLEATLEGRDQVTPDVLRVWRLAVEWTEWAHRVHGGRDAALASKDSPPDSVRFTVFTWQLDDSLAPLVPQDCRVGDWKRRFRCALAAILDVLIKDGATRAELEGADALARVIGWCAELMRQLAPGSGADGG